MCVYFIVLFWCWRIYKWQTHVFILQTASSFAVKRVQGLPKAVENPPTQEEVPFPPFPWTTFCLQDWLLFPPALSGLWCEFPLNLGYPVRNERSRGRMKLDFHLISAETKRAGWLRGCDSHCEVIRLHLRNGFWKAWGSALHFQHYHTKKGEGGRGITSVCFMEKSDLEQQFLIVIKENKPARIKWEIISLNSQLDLFVSWFIEFSTGRPNIYKHFSQGQKKIISLCPSLNVKCILISHTEQLRAYA